MSHSGLRTGSSISVGSKVYSSISVGSTVNLIDASVRIHQYDVIGATWGKKFTDATTACDEWVAKRIDHPLHILFDTLYFRSDNGTESLCVIVRNATMQTNPYDVISVLF